MTPEEIEQIQSIVRDGIDRAVEAMSANFSDVREEMNRRFDRVDERLASLEHRLDSVEYEMVGFKKSLSEAEQLDSRVATAQSAQQRTLDDLARSVRELASRVDGLERQR